MKAVLTHREAITSKAGVSYVIYRGVSPQSGRTVELFLTQEQEAQYGLSAADLVDKEAMLEFFNEQNQVDVEFNERGRVDSVSK